VIDLMALMATVACQINLFLLGAEIFTDFYFRTEEVAAATYLYLGLDGAHMLVPWIWSAIALQGLAAVILAIHRLRRHRVAMSGLRPRHRGGLDREGDGARHPWVRAHRARRGVRVRADGDGGLRVAGIWALGVLIFTLLAKVAIPIELGTLRRIGGTAPAGGRPAGPA
jgi:hypothetical protein